MIKIILQKYDCKVLKNRTTFFLVEIFLFFTDEKRLIISKFYILHWRKS
jgi:hypothetical protein